MRTSKISYLIQFGCIRAISKTYRRHRMKPLDKPAPEDTISLFKLFYSRVCLVKNMIQTGEFDWHEISGGDIDPALSEEQKTRLLAAYLESILREEIDYVAGNTSNIQYSNFMKAAYLMSALTDEIFLLRLSWFGAQYWGKYSMESNVFSSSFAGDEYYVRLQKLLSKEVLTSLDKQLAALFILTLELGFRGSLVRKGKTVSAIKKSLLKKIGLAETSRYLFPQAYGAVVNPSIAERLESFSTNSRRVIFGVAAYVLISSLVWVWFARDFLSQI